MNKFMQAAVLAINIGQTNKDGQAIATDMSQTMSNATARGFFNSG